MGHYACNLVGEKCLFPRRYRRIAQSGQKAFLFAGKLAPRMQAHDIVQHGVHLEKTAISTTAMAMTTTIFSQAFDSPEIEPETLPAEARSVLPTITVVLP